MVQHRGPPLLNVGTARGPPPYVITCAQTVPVWSKWGPRCLTLISGSGEQGVKRSNVTISGALKRFHEPCTRCTSAQTEPVHIAWVGERARTWPLLAASHAWAPPRPRVPELTKSGAAMRSPLLPGWDCARTPHADYYLRPDRPSVEGGGTATHDRQVCALVAGGECSMGDTFRPFPPRQPTRLHGPARAHALHGPHRRSFLPRCIALQDHGPISENPHGLEK